MPTRKATWAIIIWTTLMGVAIFAAALGIGDDCAGLVGGAFSSCQTDAWGRGAVGLALLGFLWLIGFILLWIVRRISGPKRTVAA